MSPLQLKWSLRQMDKFVKFLKEQNLIKDGHKVFTPQPHKDTPWWICFWILVKQVLCLPERSRSDFFLASCDVVDVNGNPVPKDKQVPTYAHAQKMRAAMTYAFGRIQRLGSVPWQESHIPGRTMMGNPSVSEIVSSYMVSLRRRKVFLSVVHCRVFIQYLCRCRPARPL